jgi:hypothetical protein
VWIGYNGQAASWAGSSFTENWAYAGGALFVEQVGGAEAWLQGHEQRQS